MQTSRQEIWAIAVAQKPGMAKTFCTRVTCIPAIPAGMTASLFLQLLTLTQPNLKRFRFADAIALTIIDAHKGEFRHDFGIFNEFGDSL